jgi:TonB family protein
MHCFVYHLSPSFLTRAILKAAMHRSRNARLALYLLLVALPCFGQNPSTASPAPGVPTIAIPPYPDTARGLEKLLSEMMKLKKEGDDQTLAAYAESLMLPNPDGWFRSVFGDQRGPEYAAASAPSRSGIETAVPSTLADLLKEKKTLIVAHRFEGSCDHAATAKEYPLLLQRESPVPLYDARFQDSATEVIWQYFAYVDGGFRYIGNLAAYPPVLPKKQSAPQGAQATAEAREKRIRVGGNVQAAKLIHQEVPRYRQEAKDARIQGTVIIHAIIAKDGSIREAHVVEGVCLLAEPALDAVKKWRYSPTLLLGEPVEVDTTISVIFTLS